MSALEQLRAEQKRLKAVFFTPRPEPVKPSTWRTIQLTKGFIEDPQAPRCPWPRPEYHSKRAFQLVGNIVRVVAEHHHITPAEVYSDRRLGVIVRARQISMYLAREVTGRSLPDLGRRFKRDHSTVIHALRSVEDKMKTDLVFAKEVLDLRFIIEGPKSCEDSPQAENKAHFCPIMEGYSDR